MLRDQAARRRMELNPLSTTLSPAQQAQQHQTPMSTTTLSAPFGYHPQPYTPVPSSTVRQYNPQQWAPSPSGYAEHVPVQQFASRPQDPDVVTPAPPPYSPPRSQPPASALSDEHNTPGRPLASYRNSPEPSSSAAFQTPPPPPHPHRRGHGERPQSIYTASSYARRTESPHVSPELTRDYNQNVTENQSIITDGFQPQVDARPPASRRAVSASAIGTPSSSRSRASSTSRWAPGMPLPPPPPGPPPASRSQSANRPPTTEAVASPPTRRPALSSSLGPVPPTPADWVDDEASRRARTPTPGLHIDTASSSEASSSTANVDSGSGSSSAGLTRQGARRGEPKSIRERRSESKSGKRVAEEPSNNPWAESITPGGTTVPPLTILGRRPTITKSTPRSGRSFGLETPRSGEMSSHSTPVQMTPGQPSRGSTPRPVAATPPFSPSPARQAFHDASAGLPPKALPTPPPQSKLAMGSPRPMPRSLNIAGSNGEAASGPSSISRPVSRQSNAEIPNTPGENFARSAIERHQAFAQKEAAASTDSERVRIFAEYIVTESRMRRERYASAIDAMGSEILELTRDLFRPYSHGRRDSNASRNSAWTPDSSAGPGTRSYRSSQFDHNQIHSEPTSASEPPSPAVLPDSTGWSNFKPSLSPIPSMSVSTALDGSDSRGRPSSRWWEVSDQGSIGNASRLEGRSKRESKYMGVPKEQREKLQYDDDGMVTPGEGAAGPSDFGALGPDEYPPEKVGFHENPTSPPLPLSARSIAAYTPQPPTPVPGLDVSRLVTLPPPYPRHHPAVNNNHPELTSIRTTVRTLSDLTEIEATKTGFLDSSKKLREENEAAAAKRQTSLRVSIQREIESGNMSFADAAQAEATAKASEREKTKEASKAEFQSFQEQVVGPLNDLLTERVERADKAFEQLRSQLISAATHQDPNSTQEEGDEQPELLEKLTLLKWIFETREVLHRELYDVLSDRNDRYKAMVIAPYAQAGNEAKVSNAEKFFAADALQRKLKNEQDILKRTEDFLSIIEDNVSSGVEALLNAFWDIAPSLSSLTSKIPASSLHGFQIQIPRDEYDENPSYYEFPMQYLHSLLRHCEAATYQFMESQINLLCLLHEVKGGVTVANCRLMRVQRVSQGEDEAEVESELGMVEREEEGRLDEDLKEKVRYVEELWGSGLGEELKGVKERVVAFLQEGGGWVEDEE